MTIQRGKDMLLKVKDGGNDSYITVAGLRSKRLQFSSTTLDVTDSSSVDRWRELLGGAGPRQASISGSGIFKDESCAAIIRQLFFEDKIETWQLIIPAFGSIVGPFQITSLDYHGEHDRELTFDITLESAGALTFTGA